MSSSSSSKAKTLLSLSHRRFPSISNPVALQVSPPTAISQRRHCHFFCQSLKKILDALYVIELQYRQINSVKPYMMQVLRKTLNSPFLFRKRPRFFTTQNPSNSPISIEPTSAYYDEAINAAGRQGDFTTVFHLLNKRARDGWLNTKTTFKFISTNLTVIDDLLQTLARLDKGLARKTAYNSLAAQLCRLHLADEALRVVDLMISGDHGANASTFYPILNLLTRKKMMDEAWRVMKLMEEKNIPPDLTAYNFLLTAYCFVGDLEQAARTLTIIEEQGMVADTRTYDALVLGACRAGKVEGALVILQRMMEDGVSPMYSTHAHVIGVLLKMGHYAQALEFVMINGGRDNKLDRENFGLLASRLINLERFDEAKFVLEEMSRRDLEMGDKLREFHLHMPKGE